MLWFVGAVRRYARAIRRAWRDPQFRLLAGALVVDLAAGMFVYRWLEGWSWIDSLYFSVVTQATVGFGDLAPQTDAGKLFTIAYIFAGIGLIVAFAQRFAGYLFPRAYGPPRDAEAARPDR